MQYFKRPPNNCFVKIDYKVINHPSLSESAELFYIRLSTLPQGTILTNTELCEKFSMSEKTLLKVKKELQQIGLFCTKQISRKLYMSFLGTTRINAYEVMSRYFTELEKDTDGNRESRENRDK